MKGMISSVLVMLSLAHAIVYKGCVVPSSDKLTLIKYYRKSCKHCQRIGPKLNRVAESIEEAGIPFVFAQVEASECKEEFPKVESVPTVVVKKEGKELGRFSGDISYEDLVDFMAEHTQLERGRFLPPVKEPKSLDALLKVTKRDFVRPFKGPWVVYFDDGKNKAIEDMLLETYRTFQGEISIAKYVGIDKEIVASRYYIYEFPTLLVFYDGILMKYNGDMKITAFNDFCTELTDPSFREVSIEEIEKLGEGGSPIFTVFYKNQMEANRIFRRIAHDLKMNAKIYKSKDESVVKLEENAIKLAVFKNGTHFLYDGDITDEAAIREWLFHTHFPNLSKLSMDNFYSIFHGLKPVALLISHGTNNKSISEFEDISASHNRGLSSSPLVFTYVDAAEYPKFAESNFGQIKAPLIVFFDPSKQVFYGERMHTGERIGEYFARMHQDYEAGTIKKYLREKPRTYKWVIFGFAGIGGALFGVTKLISSRKKIAVE
jgi:thioredoxin domain-containing protein 5